MDLFRSVDFASHVEELMKQQHVPGLSVAVVQGEETASAGYGNASLDPAKPCTADTIYDIASSSKSLTAAAVALLVDDNVNHPEIQFDTPMSKLLPEDFIISEAGYTEGITVEDILSHRSGMAPHDDSYMGPRAAKPDDARSVTRNLRNLPVAAPIRYKYLYCNMMYTVATHLVEVKSQQSFAEFLQNRFFQPLNMQSTSLQPALARSRGFGERIASGHSWDKECSAYKAFESRDCPESQGAGSVLSSANDFIKWVKAFMNREGPINERVFQDLVRMRIPVNPNFKRLKPHTSPAVYSAGVEVFYYRGHMVVGHDGMIPGFASRFFFLPERKFGAIIMGNSSGAGAVATILMREFFDEVLQVPESEYVYRNRMKANSRANKKTLTLNPKEPSNSVLTQGKKENGRNKKNRLPQKKEQRQKEDTQAESEAGSAVSPQDIALEKYTGDYTHPGYHTITVQIKGGQLFIDASDRGMAFTARLEHIGEQTKFIAHTSDLFEGGDDPVDAEFVLESDKAMKLGLHLEHALRDHVWFDRDAGIVE